MTSRWCASGHAFWNTQVDLNRDKLRHQIQQGRLSFRPWMLESTKKKKETSKYLRFHNASRSPPDDATTNNKIKDVKHDSSKHDI